MCMCNTWFGFTGVLCNEYCPEAKALLGVYAVSVVMGFLVAVWGSILLFLYITAKFSLRKQDRVEGNNSEAIVKNTHVHVDSSVNLRLNPIMYILLSAIFGTILIAMASIFGFLVVVRFPYTYDIIRVENQLPAKRISQAYDFAMYVLIIVGYCLLVCCQTILPMAWVSQLCTYAFE
jgi:hypothetical protein